MYAKRPEPFTPLLAEIDNFAVPARDQEANLVRTLAEIFLQIILCVATPIPAVTQSIKLPQWQGYGLNDATLVLVEGVIQRKGEVINIVANWILPLTADSIAK